MAQTSTGTGEKNRILIKVNICIYKKKMSIYVIKLCIRRSLVDVKNK